MTAEWTKTPWRVDADSLPYIMAGNYIMAGDVTIAKTYQAAMTMASKGPFGIPGEANASRIVRCVNTYDEIVGALENCIHSMSEVPTDAILDQFDVQDFRGTLSRARAAIAKAKGE